MSVRTDIVVTTIFEPAWLEGYLRNLRAHGRMDSTTLRIICDRKTPDSVYAAARGAAAQGFAIDCPTLEEQQAYLEQLGAPAELVPWNTDNRRNIGFLRALESGADVLISIDDDNYCPEDVDFVGEHGVVGAAAAPLATRLTVSGAPWFNICELIDFGGAAPVYARGFPYRARVAEERRTRTAAPTQRPTMSGVEPCLAELRLGPALVAVAPSHVWPSRQALHTLLRTYLVLSHAVALAPSHVWPLGQAVHLLSSAWGAPWA